MSNMLSEDMEITVAITAATGVAGTTDIEGAEVDMTGFQGCIMMVRMGAITSGAVTSLKAQQDTATGMGSAADLEGSGITVAADDDNKYFAIDIVNPKETFLRVYVDRATQNAVVEHAWYIQYRAGQRPTTTGLEELIKLNSPAEGTA
jgi:hypothetical protein